LLKSDRRSADFELNNIALGLEIALEKTMKMKVKVTGDRGNGPGRGEGDGASGGSRKQTRDRDSNHDETGTAHIRLIWQDDDEMMGALARADHDPVGMCVDINEDHRYVREAMRQRPINSAALNLMIIQEIAALLSENMKLAKDALSKSVAAELENREGYEKVRMLVRYMIDNVPGKNAAE
jgi:hypothetical protein